MASRLPSALDNRPLKLRRVQRNSAANHLCFRRRWVITELEKIRRRWVDQVVRPTGLFDPIIEVAGGDRLMIFGDSSASGN